MVAKQSPWQRLKNSAVSVLWCHVLWLGRCMLAFSSFFFVHRLLFFDVALFLPFLFLDKEGRVFCCWTLWFSAYFGSGTFCVATLTDLFVFRGSWRRLIIYLTFDISVGNHMLLTVLSTTFLHNVICFFRTRVQRFSDFFPQSWGAQWLSFCCESQTGMAKGIADEISCISMQILCLTCVKISVLQLFFCECSNEMRKFSCAGHFVHFSCLFTCVNL